MSDYLNLEAGQNEILIQLKQLPTLEFNSQRLVTFSMIDTAHQVRKVRRKRLLVVIARGSFWGATFLS